MNRGIYNDAIVGTCKFLCITGGTLVSHTSLLAYLMREREREREREEESERVREREREREREEESERVREREKGYSQGMKHHCWHTV